MKLQGLGGSNGGSSTQTIVMKRFVGLFAGSNDISVLHVVQGTVYSFFPYQPPLGFVYHPFTCCNCSVAIIDPITGPIPLRLSCTYGRGLCGGCVRMSVRTEAERKRRCYFRNTVSRFCVIRATRRFTFDSRLSTLDVPLRAERLSRVLDYVASFRLGPLSACTDIARVSFVHAETAQGGPAAGGRRDGIRGSCRILTRFAIGKRGPPVSGGSVGGWGLATGLETIGASGWRMKVTRASARGGETRRLGF